MATTLQEAIREVADIRKSYSEVNDQLAEKGRVFEQENAELIGKAAALRKAVDFAEKEAKELAVYHYYQTKETKPCPGIEVRLFRTITYDRVEAFKWAKEKQLALIPESLDEKAFEKLAKATTIPIAINEILDPRPQIASDLDKVLAAEVSNA